VKVTVAFPVAAFAAAVNAIFCGVPGVRLTVEGFAVTPEGSPLRVMLTVPVNPLLAVALTPRFCEVPAGIERLLGDSVRVKSGWSLLFDEGLAPHAMNASKSALEKMQDANLLNCEVLDMAIGPTPLRR